MSEEAKKAFLITIDTEADNQWDNNHPITTKNARFLPRFQELCEKYKFKPVWLTDYEMAIEPFFVDYMGDRQKAGLCEIGMHLHAWHTPPEYPLKKVNNQRDYLIEYPENVMSKKIETMTYLLEEKFGGKPISHRSGRWTMNDTYFKLLQKYGYKVDCSVTPHLDWTRYVGATGCSGSDYTKELEYPHYISGDVLEVPLTIRKIYCYQPDLINSIHGFFSECKKMVLGRYQWLRPDNILSNMGNLKLVDKVSTEKSDYIMFMIHSSELMPGGSPIFQTNESVEILYSMIEEIFIKVSELGYVGKTLRQYRQEFKECSEN